MEQVGLRSKTAGGNQPSVFPRVYTAQAESVRLNLPPAGASPFRREGYMQILRRLPGTIVETSRLVSSVSCRDTGRRNAVERETPVLAFTTLVQRFCLGA